MASDSDLPDRRFGWSDMFVHEDDDPRADGGWANDERSLLLGFLDDRRLTLELKCQGLDSEQMARASVPPSDMSLVGIVRHLTGVEHHWFQSVIAGEADQPPYHDTLGHDRSFAVRPDPDLVESAWSAWRSQIERSRRCIAGVVDVGERTKGGSLAVREVLVHLIREYSQHLGHADLLRERIDGRVGQ